MIFIHKLKRQKKGNYTSSYPYHNKSKGKGGTSRPYNTKGQKKGSYGSCNKYSRPSSKGYPKGKSKGKGGKTKNTQNYFQPQHDKGKGHSKNKGKGSTNIVCYFCRRPSHTSDKCWWKGQTHNLDQPTPIWSLPTDTGTQQRLQQVRQSATSTTIIRPAVTRLDQLQLYETGSFQTA
eukprot:508890-Amphidinium_carterae.1